MLINQIHDKQYIIETDASEEEWVNSENQLNDCIAYDSRLGSLGS